MCGIFGVSGSPDAAVLTMFGLHALQHRGPEAAGITSREGNGQNFHTHRGIGLVGDIFGLNTNAVSSPIDHLRGTSAVGQTRYSTSGRKKRTTHNVPPFFAEFECGCVAVTHNGNLTDADELRRRLVKRGALFQTDVDTEVILHLIATSTSSSSIEERVVDALGQVSGAYSLIILTSRQLIGVRDPHGVRPLVLGRFEEVYILASETCALDAVGAKYIRDVAPGEMITIEDGVCRSRQVGPKSHNTHPCIFERVYFARPDSLVSDSLQGKSMYEVRIRMGKILAKESGVVADIIVPVPDSGVPAALGYAEEARLPFGLGIIRNHYVGRTFLSPDDHARHLGVRLKHNANRALLRGKRVVLIDDSIVRGTTSPKIVEMVRKAGAAEVHMRISSPPITGPCYYGIDTPQHSELLAANMSLDEMRKHIDADSLAFLSLDGLFNAVAGTTRAKGKNRFCDACFTGDYPIPIACV